MDPRLEHDIQTHASHQRRLVQAVMKRQVALSLRVGAVFVAILFGLPLLNYFAPEVANARIGNFTLTWLFLGILFYPITWFLSWLFIRQSDRIEHDIATTLRHEARAAGIITDADHDKANAPREDVH